MTLSKVSPELGLRLGDQLVPTLLVLADDHGGGVAAVGPGHAQLLPTARTVLGVWRPLGAGLGAGPRGLLGTGRGLLGPSGGRGPSLRSRVRVFVAIGGVLLTLLHLGMFRALIFLQ